ncbi:conjugal transfer coupling protein TraG [uncultured Clostridium sp.]|uniref:VirD4-like conjugal transfer protein, CD1115 family n=1 Tax=Dialister invisus TaxID=218538 RepID=UPI000821B60D|nr:conjugal transfer coupling protein TraG [uncultured Clostridium sp.]
MKTADILKKYVLPNLPYLMFLWVFAKIGEAIRLAPGIDASTKLLGLADGFTLAFQTTFPSAATDWLVGLIGAALIRLVVYVKGKNARKYRKNVEYGSARWGNKADIAPFMDPKPENNIILTQTEGLMMSGRPKNPAYARNKNVLVVGGSGSGKTRFFIKPNLMQLHSSYVVTDPKGTVLVECGKLLARGAPKLGKDGKPLRNKKGRIVYEPYQIKVFNTINFKKSMHYNPFAYIHCEKDILKLVTVLIANTKGEGKSGDDFWVKAETLLYTALIGYIYYEAPQNEQNFSTLVEMINAMEVREDDESFKNAVDLLFDALEQKAPDHFALRQYKKYKLAAGKTAKSILISCGARLAPFDIAEVREITMYDELELDMVGDRKTALFFIISDTDATFNFLVSMAYTQLFNLLCERADDKYGGRLPIHVRCLIDEAANIGQIPNLEKLMATIRSREISACLVLQAQSQLKALYKDNMDTIIGNCDSSLFLGGKEETTLKSWSSLLGKETIDMYNTSVTKGNQESHGQNFQKLGKDLMSMDELAVMDGGKCLLQVRGVRPFLSKKYDITQHRNYKYLSDSNPKNTFDIEKYLSTDLRVKPGDIFLNYEISPSELAEESADETA